MRHFCAIICFESTSRAHYMKLNQNCLFFIFSSKNKIMTNIFYNKNMEGNIVHYEPFASLIACTIVTIFEGPNLCKVVLKKSSKLIHRNSVFFNPMRTTCLLVRMSIQAYIEPIRECVRKK